MKTFIILTHDRKLAEYVQNQIFKIFKPYYKDDILYIEELISILNKITKDINIETDYIDVFTASDFIRMVNDEELQDFSELFISYCYVN